MFSILSKNIISFSLQILTTLILENNAIGDQGTEYLADALKINQTLKMLNISSNDISKQGADYITGVLLLNKTLTTLILEKNSFQENMNQ